MVVVDIITLDTDAFVAAMPQVLCQANWYGYYKCSKSQQASLGKWIGNTKKSAKEKGVELATPHVQNYANQMAHEQYGQYMH